MINIKLNESEANNLLVFLNRTDLKGSETVPFIRIYNSVLNAIEDNKENNKDGGANIE